MSMHAITRRVIPARFRRTAALLLGTVFSTAALPLHAQDAPTVLKAASVAAETGTLAEFVAEWTAPAARKEPLGLLALGSASFHHYEFERADSLLAIATSSASRGPAALGERLAVSRWGRITRARLSITVGAVSDAKRLLDALGPESQLAADSLAWFEVLLLRSALEQGRSTAAAAALLDSAEALGAARHPRRLASLRCRQAALAGRGGSLEQVRVLADAGIAAARAADSRRLAGTCHFVRATVFARLGATDSLRQALARAVELQRASHDLPALAASLQWEGYYLLNLGRHERAQRRLSEAWDVASAARSDNVRAWTALSRATLAAQLNDHREALLWLGRADTLMAQLGDTEGARYVLGLRGEFAFAAGDTAAAWRVVARTAAMHREAGDRLAELSALSDLVEKAVALGFRDRAVASLARLEARAAELPSPVYENSHRVTAGEVALLAGDTHGALARFDSALAALHPTQYAFRHRVAVMKAVALTRLRRFEEARQVAIEGETLLDAWRARLADSVLLRFATRTEHRRRPYHTELITALAAAGHLEDALRLAESQQSRRLRDQLVEAVAWARMTTPTPRTRFAAVALPDLQASLPRRTALLEFVAGRGPVPSALLVVVRDSAWSLTLPAMDSLAPIIQRVLAQLEAARPHQPGARELGRAIFDPIEEALAGRDISRLVIVPDDALHLVPFSALLLRNGDTALERWEISTVPSAAVATTLWQASSAPARGRGVLAFGDPRDVTTNGEAPAAPIQPPLPGARREMQAIQRAHATSSVHAGGEATEARFKRLAESEGDVLHVAAHGSIAAWDSRGASLRLGADNVDDGVVHGGEVAVLRLRARLVLLSACATDAGVLVRGEGINGLTSAFLRAGAHSVITSSWRVSDAGTERLMGTLHQALSSGADAGAALRTAQLDALRRGEPASVWSAFRVVGNARLQPEL